MIKHLFLIVLICMGMATQAGAAQDKLNYNSFAKIPVQHDGRIKPMDTFARIFLNTFSGGESLNGMNAQAWMAETLFDPAQAMQRPVFRILRPDILDLPAREKKYYSYVEIAPALQNKAPLWQALTETDEKTWTEDQRELARLEEASILYTQLLRSFSFILPLNIIPPASLVKAWTIPEEKPFTVQEYRRYETRLNEKVRQIIASKGHDPVHYSKEQKEIVDFAFQMQILEQAGQNNVLLRLFPGQQDGIKGEWFSPWAITQSGEASPQTATAMKNWQAMAQAYQNRDNAAWQQATVQAASLLTSNNKLLLEIFYNGWHPLLLAMGFYLVSFLGVLFYSLSGRRGWWLASLSALCVGSLAHLGTIVLRILILSRPPVGTLYESILFVACICVIVAIILEFIRKDGTGLITGAVSGLLLLFVAEAFAGDDTMKMLVAVLNTNFWLGTHVLCITMGYGWCLVVSFLAHLWLARKAFGKESASLVMPVKTLCLVSLLFTAIGTILGGIWADQSWGRFWGWDPKENGALLIVLWLIWCLHGLIAGQLKRTAFMASIAGLSIVVAVAWFGVNLLSVGLHSYGFITGVAAGLGAFCAGEVILISGLWYLIVKHEARGEV